MYLELVYREPVVRGRVVGGRVVGRPVVWGPVVCGPVVGGRVVRGQIDLASPSRIVNRNLFIRFQVPIEFCKANGIRVGRVPSYSPSSIAEYAISSIMALAKNIQKSYELTKEADFTIGGLQVRNLIFLSLKDHMACWLMLTLLLETLSRSRSYQKFSV